MIIIGIVLSVFGLGFFCWLLFTLAVYAVPATIAGYHATLGLAHIGVPAEGWRAAFAVVGAILIGGATWVRMTLFIPPNAGRQVAGGPALLSPAGATREG